MGCSISRFVKSRRKQSPSVLSESKSRSQLPPVVGESPNFDDDLLDLFSRFHISDFQVSETLRSDTYPLEHRNFLHNLPFYPQDNMDGSAPEQAYNSPVTSPPATKKPAPPVLRRNCIICCTEFEGDEINVSLVKPCRNCASHYCKACTRNIFVRAMSNMREMPARCCGMIPIHIGLPYLSKEEVTKYREMLQEWMTPNPTYCPIPTCSAFLLPARIAKEPTCPKCETRICISCGQKEHPDAACTKETDPDLENALKEWGYRRCPKCRTGIKRMYGCTHMQCVCGAQWCWWCQRPISACTRNCAPHNAGEETDGDDDEPVVPEEHPLPAAESSEDLMEGAEADRTLQDLPFHPDANLSTTALIPPEPPAVLAPVAGPSVDNATTPSIHHRQPNLDRGSPHYWENQDLDFGEEPNEDEDEGLWHCDHIFNGPMRMQFAYAEEERKAGRMEMECMKCFAPIEPEIFVPLTVPSKQKGKEKKRAREPDPAPEPLTKRPNTNSATDPIPSSPSTMNSTYASGSSSYASSASSLPVPKSRAYDCRSCEVIYCQACMEAHEKPKKDKVEEQMRRKREEQRMVMESGSTL